MPDSNLASCKVSIKQVLVKKVLSNFKAFSVYNFVIFNILSLDVRGALMTSFYCTKMNPIASICMLPLTPPVEGPFLSFPPVPKPIPESQLLQSFSLLPRIPILALAGL